jgi:hypothetical protein
MEIILTWEDPSAQDQPEVPTRPQIGALLAANPGQSAIVARHDRAARAVSHVERIVSGREYGDGYAAVARRVGNEHRVYATCVAA